MVDTKFRDLSAFRANDLGGTAPFTFNVTVPDAGAQQTFANGAPSSDIFYAVNCAILRISLLFLKIRAVVA